MFVRYRHSEAIVACSSLARNFSLGAHDLAPLNVNLNDNDIQPPGSATFYHQHINTEPPSSYLRKCARLQNPFQLAIMADREQPVTLRTRKFIRNALLGRKQMVV